MSTELNTIKALHWTQLFPPFDLTLQFQLIRVRGMRYLLKNVDAHRVTLALAVRNARQDMKGDSKVSSSKSVKHKENKVDMYVYGNINEIP